MAKAKGLGKGLDALMGDSVTMQSQEAGSVMLPISQVEPGLNQPRKRFDDEALADLAASIEEHGIIQPLTVRRLSTGYYQIIAGERRWRAAKLAGLNEIPAVIIEADDRKVMELGLIENLQREDLNPIEEANGYKVLMSEYGLTQEEVAQRVYLSPTYFSRVFKAEMGEPFTAYLNRIRIEHSKELLRHKSIRLTDIAQLVGFEDQSYFTKVFKKLVGVPPLQYRNSKN